MWDNGQIYYFEYGYPTLPALFLKRLSSDPLNCFGTSVKKLIDYICECLLQDSLLFHWFICLPIYQQYNMLMITTTL